MYCRKWFTPTPGRCQCWLIIMGRITILVAGSGSESRVRPEGFIAYNGAVSNPEKTIRLTRPAREDLLFTSPGDRYFLLSQLSSAELVDRNTPVTPSRFSDSNSDHPPASVGAVLVPFTGSCVVVSSHRYRHVCGCDNLGHSPTDTIGHDHVSG